MAEARSARSAVDKGRRILLTGGTAEAAEAARSSGTGEGGQAGGTPEWGLGEGASRAGARWSEVVLR